jgi:voltage-gated potassium channel
LLIVRLMNQFVEFVARVSWPMIGAIFLLLYGFGAVVLGVTEKGDSGFQSIADYSWWFLVTITTVGYGDLAPATPTGRLTAAVIMIFGISAIGVVLGKVGEGFFEIGRKRMRGLSRLDEEGHIIIFGYNAGETEQMLEEIVADAQWSDRSIVLCSNTEDENPIPDRVKFIRGVLSSDDVIERACVATAGVIIIQSHDDRTTIVTAIAANSVNPDAHIVANLDDAENEKHLKRINAAIECVVPLGIPMTVQALQDPGITKVMLALVSNVNDDVFYRIDVPILEGGGRWAFGGLFETLKRDYDAILVGIANSTEPGAEVDINPPSDFEVQSGMTLFYIASERLEALDWTAL